MAIENRQLIGCYGPHWARNKEVPEAGVCLRGSAVTVGCRGWVGVKRPVPSDRTAGAPRPDGAQPPQVMRGYGSWSRTPTHQRRPTVDD